MVQMSEHFRTRLRLGSYLFPTGNFARRSRRKPPQHPLWPMAMAMPAAVTLVRAQRALIAYSPRLRVRPRARGHASAGMPWRQLQCHAVACRQWQI